MNTSEEQLLFLLKFVEGSDFVLWDGMFTDELANGRKDGGIPRSSRPAVLQSWQRLKSWPLAITVPLGQIGNLTCSLKL